MSDSHEQNRRSWNAVTSAHQSHKKDQVEFFRGGGSTLFDDEVALLGASWASLWSARRCGYTAAHARHSRSKTE